MASASKLSPAPSDRVKKRVVTSVWLIMALLTSASALAVWMFSAVPAFDKSAQVAKEPSVEASVFNIGQIKHIDEITQLEDAVQPISFDALVRDLREYPDEFKDSKYLTANKGKWTVQVMDVTEHEIITDYLATRTDREKFAYFRYRDADNQARYLLTYDILPTPQMAMGAAKSIEFNLPANVRVLPEEIDRYIDLIENYELSEPVSDLSANRARNIKLQPTRSELPARRSARSTRSSSETTSKTNSNTLDSEQTAGSSNTAEDDSDSTSSSTSPRIKGSTDPDDTLLVKEKRKVVDTEEIVEGVGLQMPQNQPTKPESVKETTTPVKEQPKPAVPQAKSDQPKLNQPKEPIKPETAQQSAKPKVDAEIDTQ